MPPKPTPPRCKAPPKKNCAAAQYFKPCQVLWEGDFVNSTRSFFCSSSHFSLSSVRLDKASAISAPARFRIHLMQIFNRKIHQKFPGSLIVIFTKKIRKVCFSQSGTLFYVYTIIYPFLATRILVGWQKMIQGLNMLKDDKQENSVWHQCAHMYHSMLPKNVAMSQCPKSATRQTLLLSSATVVSSLSHPRKQLPGSSVVLHLQHLSALASFQDEMMIQLEHMSIM